MPDDPTVDAVVAAFTTIARTSETYFDTMARALSPTLKRGALAPLLFLHRTGPSRVTAIAADLGLDRTTVTRHLDELEDRGLVRRYPSPDDRRVVVSEVTESASTALRRSQSALADRTRRITSTWSTDELTTFADLLARFAGSSADLVDADPAGRS